jgi:hypothetical protein
VRPGLPLVARILRDIGGRARRDTLTVEIASVRAARTGGHSGGLTWRGEVPWSEIRRRSARADGRGHAGLHQAIHRYFQQRAGDPPGHLERIGYQLPPLTAGDLITIADTAWIVTEAGSFQPAKDSTALGALQQDAMDPSLITA